MNFFGRGAYYPVCYIYTYVQKISCISWERSSFIFRPKKKYHVFGERIPSFQIIQEISYSCAIVLKRLSFQNIWRKYNISMYFFRERSSFIFCQRNKIIFSGKRNIIFPNNTRKIIFRGNFLWKTIFSGRLEKENMVFHSVVGQPKQNKRNLDQSLLNLYGTIVEGDFFF